MTVDSRCLFKHEQCDSSCTEIMRPSTKQVFANLVAHCLDNSKRPFITTRTGKALVYFILCPFCRCAHLHMATVPPRSRGKYIENNTIRNTELAPNPSLSSQFAARVPGSVLLLLAFSRDPANDPEVNIKAEAAARGVHPDRIRLDEMLSREEHIWVRPEGYELPCAKYGWLWVAAVLFRRLCR